MQGQSSTEKVEFILVPVYHRSRCPITWIRDHIITGFGLCKFDRKTLPSNSSSVLYVLVTGHFYSIYIVIVLFKLYKELKFLLFQRSVVRICDQFSFYCNTFRANCSIRIMYIYSYTVSVSVKQLYKSKVYTFCLLIK